MAFIEAVFIPKVDLDPAQELHIYGLFSYWEFYDKDGNEIDIDNPEEKKKLAADPNIIVKMPGVKPGDKVILPPSHATIPGYGNALNSLLQSEQFAKVEMFETVQTMLKEGLTTSQIWLKVKEENGLMLANTPRPKEKAGG